MAKTKAALERTAEKLSTHKFDTSKYIVLHSPVRRDSATGNLTSSKAASRATKAVRAK
jgi:hypothetical protein